MGKFWTSFGFTLMASIFLVLTCEAPTIALEKILFSRRKDNKSVPNIVEKPVNGQV